MSNLPGRPRCPSCSDRATARWTLGEFCARCEAALITLGTAGVAATDLEGTPTAVEFDRHDLDVALFDVFQTSFMAPGARDHPGMTLAAQSHAYRATLNAIESVAEPSDLRYSL